MGPLLRCDFPASRDSEHALTGARLVAKARVATGRADTSLVRPETPWNARDKAPILRVPDFDQWASPLEQQEAAVLAPDQITNLSGDRNSVRRDGSLLSVRIELTDVQSSISGECGPLSRVCNSDCLELVTSESKPRGRLPEINDVRRVGTASWVLRKQDVVVRDEPHL